MEGLVLPHVGAHVHNMTLMMSVGLPHCELARDQVRALLDVGRVRIAQKLAVADRKIASDAKGKLANHLLERGREWRVFREREDGTVAGVVFLTREKAIPGHWAIHISFTTNHPETPAAAHAACVSYSATHKQVMFGGRPGWVRIFRNARYRIKAAVVPGWWILWLTPRESDVTMSHEGRKCSATKREE
jgi:hypothetical protein